MGHSAGAYNAAMLNLDRRWLGGVGMNPDTDVAAFVGLAGPYDFLPLQSDVLKTIFGPEESRPATQPIPGLIPLDELRTLFQQLGQQLTAQGITGRHQPRSTVPPAGVAEDPEEPFVDPRYAAAQDALGEGNIELAVAEYQKLVDGNPADTEAAAGLAMAKLLQRTQGVDLQEARAAAAASPDDIDAQTMVADLDMLGGHVDDAFTRLIDVVRRTSDADRNKAREHLITLFGAVGNDDPRVRKARQNLASALF
jgi:putative thioredoxin